MQWPNLIAYWAGKPPVRGLNHLERFVGLERFTKSKVPAKQPVTVGGPGFEVKPARMTKAQEYDAHLNYEVTIPRWRFELMRLGAWFVGFQVSFALFLLVPLVVLRAVLGVDSPYVP